jgi:DNA polymerase-3 subunit gamma/tau
VSDGVVSDTSPTLSDLTEIWHDLLEELLEQDRAAWNAVKHVQPLELRPDHTLAIGLASQADLEVFKTDGAGPLREAIVGALGINVKYVPRPLPQGSPQGTPQAPNTQRESHPAPQEPSPTEPAPPYEPAPVPPSEPAPPHEPTPPQEPVPPSTPAPPSFATAAATQPPALSAQRSKSLDPPGFTRYGESVVREVFDAKFIEERPLPSGLER